MEADDGGVTVDWVLSMPDDDVWFPATLRVRLAGSSAGALLDLLHRRRQSDALVDVVLRDGPGVPSWRWTEASKLVLEPCD